MATKPEVGKLYKHYKGNVYRVLHIANEKSDRPGWPITVVYQDIDSHAVWARTLEEWNGSSYTLIK